MARYEVTIETDRSRVHRTTGKLPTEVVVKHHARSMEHALGGLLRLELYPDGRWVLYVREPTNGRMSRSEWGTLPTN